MAENAPSGAVKVCPATIAASVRSFSVKRYSATRAPSTPLPAASTTFPENATSSPRVTAHAHKTMTQTDTSVWTEDFISPP